MSFFVVLLVCSLFFCGVEALVFQKTSRTFFSQSLPFGMSSLSLQCTSTPNAVSATVKEEAKKEASTEVTYHPMGTKYVMCSQCKTAYLMDEKTLGRGSRVECTTCGKDWYQTPDRLMTTDKRQQLTVMPDNKIQEVKRILADKNFPRYPRVDKVGVFVGNLPYSFTEKELGELFGEYGLTNIALVKDAEQQSKGFAFLECSNLKDAETMVEEMHHFYAEANRKLTVRLSTPGTGGGGTRSGGVNRRGGGGGGGGRGGGGGGGGAPPGGKKWTKRN